MNKNLSVALAHDHLNQFGGAEQVLMQLHKLFPQAPVYTVMFDSKIADSLFPNWDIRASFLQKAPAVTRLFKWYLNLMPAAVEHLNLSDYNLVISSCSALIKGLVLKPETVHICYCHTPTRYLWSDTHQYTEDLEQPKIIKKILPLILTKLRQWDQLAAQRVDHFIANSQFVARRINKYYHRPAEVIYPPVDLSNFKISSKVEDYYLVVSRLRPYKRVDLAITAFNKLGIPLKIIGAGEQEQALKKLAKNNIEFLGPVTEAEKAHYLSRAKALIFPQEEDFGITAVESLASGRPVIAYGGGGVLEIIQDGVGGKLFVEQNWQSLADAVIRFRPESFDPMKLRQESFKFDNQIFAAKLQTFINKAMGK